MTAIRSAQGHGLGLVVGDDDGGQPALDQPVLDPGAQDGAQARLELAHGLVEEEEVGVADKRAGEAGALLLARRRSWADSGP